MNPMVDLKTIEDINDLIHQHELVFIYISRPDCSVCHGLLPQVKKMLDQFPAIVQGHVNADDVAEVAGLLSVFTVPVLLLFVHGKEYIREARIVHLDLLQEKINKIYIHVVDK